MKGTGRRAAMIRAAAIANMAGPVLFVGVLVVLTVVQYDFMLGIGWRPLGDPAGAWPSGLTLGPYGWVQISNFVVSGLLLVVFAVGLHCGVTDGRGSRIGPGLLFVAGIAMVLMGFETDPIMRTTPRTLHGWIHDLAFVLFALALLSALFLSAAEAEKRSPLAQPCPLHTRNRCSRYRPVCPAGGCLLSLPRCCAPLAKRHWCQTVGEHSWRRQGLVFRDCVGPIDGAI